MTSAASLIPRLLAESTAQEQFLQSVNRNSGSSVDGIVLLQIVLAGVALVLIAVGIRQYLERRRSAGKRTLRDPHKLAREMSKKLGLSAAQMRKLTHHSRRLGAQHPVTLLLCPSLLDADLVESPVDVSQASA